MNVISRYKRRMTRLVATLVLAITMTGVGLIAAESSASAATAPAVTAAARCTQAQAYVWPYNGYYYTPASVWSQFTSQISTLPGWNFEEVRVTEYLYKWNGTAWQYQNNPSYDPQKRVGLVSNYNKTWTENPRSGYPSYAGLPYRATRPVYSTGYYTVLLKVEWLASDDWGLVGWESVPVLATSYLWAGNYCRISGTVSESTIRSEPLGDGGWLSIKTCGVMGWDPNGGGMC